MEHKIIIKAVKTWVETLVVGLNLCPFAKRELLANRVRFSVTEAATEEQLLAELQVELELLNGDDSIETTLLIHPEVLQDFYDYNQFLDYVDGLLLEMGLEGVYQVASFHPDYQFGGTEPDDAENYTNRSPYPILHLIREASLEQAVANHPDSDGIPERNIALANSLGRDKMQALLKACSHDTGKQ
ncbi:MAG: DUF1415 domain-containing protein [Porticoccus sp.]